MSKIPQLIIGFLIGTMVLLVVTAWVWDVTWPGWACGGVFLVLYLFVLSGSSGLRQRI